MKPLRWILFLVLAGCLVACGRTGERRAEANGAGSSPAGAAGAPTDPTPPASRDRGNAPPGAAPPAAKAPVPAGGDPSPPASQPGGEQAAAKPAGDQEGGTLRALFAERGIRVGTVGRMNKFPDKPAPFYNDARYREVLAREFDAVIGIGTIDILKDGSYRFDHLDDLLEFSAEHGIEVHEQLIFTKDITPRMIPLMERALSKEMKRPVRLSGMSKKEADAAKQTLLRRQFTKEERDEGIALLEDHVTRIMTRYKGRIRHWRVINEALNPRNLGRQPLRDSFWTKVIGEEFIEIALRAAHRADPDALLNINDYDMEGLGPKSDAMYALVADLKKRGVPLDAVGFQMHIKTDGYPSADEVRRNIRRLAALGLEVYITEIDVALKMPLRDGDLERQAARFREMAEVCLSEPACTKFFTWGFTDRYSWIPYVQPGYGDALIFDDSYAPKPAYRALQDAARAR